MHKWRDFSRLVDSGGTTLAVRVLLVATGVTTILPLKSVAHDLSAIYISSTHNRPLAVSCIGY